MKNDRGIFEDGVLYRDLIRESRISKNHKISMTSEAQILYFYVSLIYTNENWCYFTKDIVGFHDGWLEHLLLVWI